MVVFRCLGSAGPHGPGTDPWKRQQGQAARLQRGGSSGERNSDNCVRARGRREGQNHIQCCGYGQTETRSPGSGCSAFAAPSPYRPSALEASQMRGKPQLCASHSWGNLSKAHPRQRLIPEPRGPPSDPSSAREKPLSDSPQPLQSLGDLSAPWLAGGGTSSLRSAAPPRLLSGAV